SDLSACSARTGNAALHGLASSGAKCDNWRGKGRAMLRNPPGQVHRPRSASADETKRWLGWIGLAIAVGVAYFLSARLSLALLTKPDGVAVFWPASGVAAGVLIALGPGARLPVTAGTI